MSRCLAVTLQWCPLCWQNNRVSSTSVSKQIMPVVHGSGESVVFRLGILVSCKTSHVRLQSFKGLLV